MEGLGHDRRPPLSHGFKVGVGTVAIAALYERLLERDLAALDPEALARAWPGPEDAEAAVRAAHTTPGLDDAAVTETLAKHADPETLARRLALLADRWPDLRDRLRAQLLPATELRELLAAAGAPTRPSELGLTMDAFRDTYRRARMIRRRYTVLDLAAETGTLDELVGELFAAGGFWPPRTYTVQ
jgi:glycerol-1-phosphate dehydrogenase [NAD(P)+]